MTISAKVIADSISAGIRITTYELEYPRFIHAEFLTHRLFSRNAASSRAIPVKKQIELVKENPAMPIHWGMNEPGMSASEECNEYVATPFPWTEGKTGSREYWIIDGLRRDEAWLAARDRAVEVAEAFANAGYHKQIVNRILEPFSHIKVVLTSTEFDNFWWLRNHPDAQPEIHELAKQMLKALGESEPVLLKQGDWHLPYYNDGYWRLTNHDRMDRELEEAIAISASCCAQVSYRRLDDSPEKAMNIYKRLVESKPVHASPFEHQATPMKNRAMGHIEPGYTHQDVYGYNWSANFRGWIQNRQLIDEHTCWNYDTASKTSGS
jgi:hypothetical protein